MQEVRHFEVLCNLGAIAVEVVSHIVVLFAEYAPADEVTTAARHSHESAVNLVGETLGEAKHYYH